MHFLSWGSYFWWMDSRSETAGLGDAYAVHFGRCLQIAFQRACHNSYSHQQDVRWPFPASQPAPGDPGFLGVQASSGPGVHPVCQERGAPTGLAWGCWQLEGMEVIQERRLTVKAGSSHRWCWFLDLRSCRWPCSGHTARVGRGKGQLLCQNESTGQEERSPSQMASATLVFMNSWIPRILWLLCWFVCFLTFSSC